MFETPTPPRERGPSREWTTTYVMSISGILKIAEMVLSLVGFICAVVYPYQSSYGIGWTSFVCITGFIQSAASFTVHIINYFPDETLAYVIELIVYAVYTLFFLIAAIVAAVLAGYVSHSAPGAAAFFCFACLVVWAIDTVVQFLSYNRRRQETTSSSGPPPTSTTATDAPTY